MSLPQGDVSVPRGAPSRGWTLAAVACGTFLMLVAFTMPLATIVPTAASLDAGVAGRTWVLSSMSIGLASALLTSGAVADDFGRRRTFVAGLFLMALTSVVCVVAPDTVTFVLARVLQGVGGAAVTASSLGIIAHTFPAGPERASASGVWGAALGAGIAVGPVVAGLCDAWVSWRLAYALLAAACVATAALALGVVRESRAARPRPVDRWGGLLLAVGLGSLLAGLVESRQDLGDPLALALFGGAVLALVAFVAVERRGRAPMLDLMLLRHRRFLAVTVAAFATGMGIIALFSFMAVFLDTGFGIDALGASLLLLSWSATSVAASLLARRIPEHRVSGRVQLAIGLVGVAVGQAGLAAVGPDTSWPRFVPALLVAGVASGVLNAALGREAVAAVPVGREAMGAGANNTARYVGSAIGVTVVAVIVASHGTSRQDLFDGWNVAVLLTAAFSLVGAAVVLTCRPARDAR
ncbi:MFS transporter [Mumia sp. zg.B53]|uniref:MFS transporter n=1 Tax=Mumia sp. zg.B53 TaxID=2855449 RepID=UPI001C6EE1E8|nr:MFS transporter [Mumia sp. zg.B53]MBW9215774.1 MFS transporter [Mumia sp. zg.B53]